MSTDAHVVKLSHYTTSVLSHTEVLQLLRLTRTRKQAQDRSLTIDLFCLHWVVYAMTDVIYWMNHGNLSRDFRSAQKREAPANKFDAFWRVHHTHDSRRCTFCATCKNTNENRELVYVAEKNNSAMLRRFSSVNKHKKRFQPTPIVSESAPSNPNVSESSLYRNDDGFLLKGHLVENRLCADTIWIYFICVFSKKFRN